jgi:hypothetical protein
MASSILLIITTLAILILTSAVISYEYIYRRPKLHKELSDLKGKVVIITGASRGIGEEVSV